MQKLKLVLDYRMSANSGIGVYLTKISEVLDQKKHLEIRLLDSSSRAYKAKNISFKSRIYSLKEQLVFPFIIPSADFFWSPHYNVPILPIRAKHRVVTIHDVCHLALSDQLSFFQRLYARIMIRLAVKFSDIIITVSEFSKSEIVRFTGTNKEIHVVHNGVGLVDYSLGEEESQILLDPYILYVGNVKPHKNLGRALLAFESLAEKYPDHKLVIVGKKENFINGDDDFLNKAVLNESVLFTGYVDDSVLGRYYKGATLLLFPSLYEGFGLPPLEAQSYGCAVACSNAASLPEVCGDAALYFDPYDVEDISAKLEALLESEQLRSQLRIKGFENIKRFSWEKASNTIFEIISSYSEKKNRYSSR